ncbi:Uncharacterised protein [Raoultella planticola]|uniref:Outer membrane protein/protective antigen OMA87 n=1 Tax=Raoultella planticola TaxID=575 RepID=A0A485CX76_RAOPL|nr:Uncharacterised protein [Raoultella planticola]
MRILNFLTGGRLNAYGLGGSLMLDYELFSKEQDIDVELRYSGMSLQTFGSTPEAVSGQSSAENIGLYLRRRAPISDWTLLKSPVRYVLEGAHTEYLGDQRGQLGFNGLSSLGVGLELDSSQYPVFISRTRLVARYMFGDNTRGYGVGLAMSFLTAFALTAIELRNMPLFFYFFSNIPAAHSSTSAQGYFLLR